MLSGASTVPALYPSIIEPMNPIFLRRSLRLTVRAAVFGALLWLPLQANDSHGTPAPASEHGKADHAKADDHGKAAHAAPAGVLTPGQALAKLLEGNFRYFNGQSQAQAEHLKKRDANVKGQKPFAIIVSCSDSRVPPEVVFDQSVGDLFVVRSAGHVVDDVAIGSIEYAVEHLGTTLILVLGHERCGAVAATCAGGEAPAHIAAVVKAIKPAADAAKPIPGDFVDNTVKTNALAVVNLLSASEPVLASLVKEGKLKVQGARYDLDTGKVELLE